MNIPKLALALVTGIAASLLFDVFAKALRLSAWQSFLAAAIFAIVCIALTRKPSCRRGHDWFPGGKPPTFLPTHQICMRCMTLRVELPIGLCVGGASPHPLAEHYDDEGNAHPIPGCAGPR